MNNPQSFESSPLILDAVPEGAELLAQAIKPCDHWWYHYTKPWIMCAHCGKVKVL